MSLYNTLPERGYVVRIWPARYPDAKRKDSYGYKLAPKIIEAMEKDPTIVGKPTDPQRFSDVDLLEREASYGRSGFALQFMLDTSLSDAERYPLKLADLIVMNLNPELAPEKVVWATSPELIINDIPNVGFTGDKFYRPMTTQGEWIPYQGAVMSIDPSGRGRDETGYAVVKMLHSQLFVTEAGGLSGGYSPQTLKELCEIAKKNKVNKVVIESNFGDGMFLELLKPYMIDIWPCSMEEVKHSIQKEKRIIDTLEPVMNQHRLIFDRKVVEGDWRSTQHLPSEQALKYQLFYQMTRITQERGALTQDDRLDALAIAVNYWVEQMGRDVDLAMRQMNEDRMNKELESFIDHVVGDRKPRKMTWLNRLS